MRGFLLCLAVFRLIEGDEEDCGKDDCRTADLLKREQLRAVTAENAEEDGAAERAEYRFKAHNDRGGCGLCVALTDDLEGVGDAA